MKTKRKNMEYHISCFNDLKLCNFVKTHPFPKYSFIKDKIVPNIKTNCVKYDKETKLAHIIHAVLYSIKRFIN